MSPASGISSCFQLEETPLAAGLGGHYPTAALREPILNETGSGQKAAAK
jgi:hypothetical protein